ncbi:replicative DNA helicase [Testudinibacter sp. P80/BLE/0925]|uniref:replicative DNA helicase n=1 Tax=Testudinibacter sp. TW-1 TaxID=3417757 RepID=UPI003D36968A
MKKGQIVKTELFDNYLESSVLGGLILDNDKWDEVSPLLTDNSFYLQWNRVIFKAIKSHLDTGKPVDLLILEQSLKSQWDSDNGLFAYLAEIVKNTPSAALVVNYAQRLLDYQQLRQLAALGKDLSDNSKQIKAKDDIDKVIADSEKRLFDIACRNQAENTLVNLSRAMEIVFDKIEQSCHSANPISGAPCGIAQIDQMTTGFQPSDFIVIAARPGMGKTAFALTAIAATLEAIDKPVQFYSLEMPGDQIMMRFLSMQSKVPMQLLRNALLMEDEDFAKLGVAANYIQQHWEDNNRLLIDDSSALTPQILRTRVRKNIRLYGKPSAIFIDYLQLMKYPGSQNRYEEVTNISNSLKALAKEMQCPVIALAQLNRGVEGRIVKKPTSSDLRDSGAIEQDADVIILLHRDEYYTEEASQAKGLAEVIIGKQRNGPVGTVVARFFGQYSLFETYAAEGDKTQSSTDIGDFL